MLESRELMAVRHSWATLSLASISSRRCAISAGKLATGILLSI